MVIMKKGAMLILLVIILGGAVGYYYYQNTQTNQPTPKKTEVANLREVTIAMPFVAARQLPLIVADREGFLKEQGLKVKMLKVEKDLASVLATGRIPVSMSSAASALPPAISGADLVWVAQLANDNPSGLVSYKKAKEIKSIGVQSGVSRTLSLAVLRKMGLNPGNITFENMPSNPAKFAALKEKKIDAIFVTLMDWEMFKAKTKLGPEYSVLEKTDRSDNLLPTWLVARKAFIESDRDVVEGVIKALLKADDFIKSNPEKAMADLQAESKQYTKSDAKIIVDGYIDALSDLDIVPNVSTIKKLLPILAKDNPKAKDFNPESFVDSSLIQEATSSAK